MSPARWATKNDRVTLFFVVAIAFAGVFAYLKLPKAEDPGFVVRTAAITTAFPGASPVRVEELVTSAIEERVQEIPQLDVVYSVSSTGQSVVYVDIQERYADMRPIWDDLRRKVASLQPDLPPGIIGPIVDDDFGDVYGIVIALVADGFTPTEMSDMAEDLRKRLLRIPDAAKVAIHGDQARRVHVEFDEGRLADLGLSPLVLRAALAEQNILTPGGVVYTGGEQLALEPSGAFGSVQELRRTLIPVPGAREPIPLGDLATIEEGTVDPAEPRVHFTGERALAIAVSMREGGNNARLGEQVSEVLREREQHYPIGVDLEAVNFQPDLVQEDVNTFASNLGQSVLIVMLVMMGFLGARTGLVVASLIPMSMLATLACMYVFDIGINAISLASMLMALGMLVDNAIVMAESTFVGLIEGKEPTQAAIDAAGELQVPLLIASGTTAAAFLPIYLSESATGEFTRPLFTVITISLLSSWLLSITVIPLFCAHFLRPPEVREEPRWVTRGYALYAVFLRGTIRWPRTVLALATALLILAGWVGLTVVDSKFFPPSDKAQLAVELELAPSATLAETERVVYELERFLARELKVERGSGVEGVVDWAAYIGASGPRFELSFVPKAPSDQSAFLLVNTTSRDAVDPLCDRIEDWLYATLPDVDVEAHPLVVGPPAGKPVAVRISAPSEAALMEKAEVVKDYLRGVAGTRNIRDDWGRRTKKLEVRVDPVRARAAGVSHADVALSLQTSLSGMVATEYREGDAIIPVVLRSRTLARRDLGRVEGLTVFPRHGPAVPLKQVADVRLSFEAPEILRRDLEKTMEISAELDGTVNPGRTARKVQRWVAGQVAGWGPEYRWEPSGEGEASAKAQAAIVDQLPAAALVICTLLMLQFNSWRKPFINLAVLPYGLIGVTFGLLVMDSYFGFMTLLGTVSLFGIVINNANVLLDRIETEIGTFGRDPTDAVLVASRRRLRPILLTTATTVGGLLPLYFGGGPVFEPMAIALIFGLVFGTILTLGLVPALYSVLYKLEPAPLLGGSGELPREDTEWIPLPASFREQLKK